MKPQTVRNLAAALRELRNACQIGQPFDLAWQAAAHKKAADALAAYEAERKPARVYPDHVPARQFAFHDRVPATAPDILNGATPAEWLADRVYRGGYSPRGSTIVTHGETRSAGYIYNFRPWLRRFVVIDSHGDLRMVYALNRTTCRAVCGGSRCRILAEIDS